MVVQACCGKHAYTARASLQAVVPREAKFHIESRVGRLIETRLEWLGSASDVLAIERALGQAFVQAGPNPIICSDWRGIDVFPPDVGDALLEVLRRDNARIERSAVLLSAGSAIFNLQVERLLREAGNPSRRAFRDVELLLAWVGEVLRPEELERARALFAK